jgi:hypothetical protein
MKKVSLENPLPKQIKWVTIEKSVVAEKFRKMSPNYFIAKGRKK